MVQNNYFNFVGVSTDKSAVNILFPKWCNILGISCDIKSINIPLNSHRSNYIAVLEDMNNHLCVGGLITSHKSNIFRYGKNKFKQLSYISNHLEEVSAIYKKGNDNELFGDAIDIISIIPTLNKLTVNNIKWLNGNKNIIIFGAGGAGLALVYALYKNTINTNNIILVEKNTRRYKFLKKIQKRENTFFLKQVQIFNSISIKDTLVEFGKSPLVVNATGMGKDIDGTPINDLRLLSDNSTIWDFNYRGELKFLNDGHNLSSEKGFLVEDGWEYFIYGWLYVMCRVFKITPTQKLYNDFHKTAMNYYKHASLYCYNH